MKLTILDSTGAQVNIGDLVQLQSKSNLHHGDKTKGLTFWTRVKLIDGVIYPFNRGFSFDRIIKVDEIPEGEIHHAAENGDMPEYWMNPKTEMYLIENNILDRWRMDVLMFEYNNFFKVEE